MIYYDWSELKAKYLPSELLTPSISDVKVSLTRTSVVAPLSRLENGLKMWDSEQELSVRMPRLLIFCSHSWVPFIAGSDCILYKQINGCHDNTTNQEVMPKVEMAVYFREIYSV